MVITGALVEAFVSGLLVGITICVLAVFGYVIVQDKIQRLERKVERLEDDN
jgi:uncharacterized membrane protein YciS (DUF1049 family)